MTSNFRLLCSALALSALSTACAHAPAQAPEKSSDRNPAMWTQTTLQAPSELSRGILFCQNTNKLTGTRSGMLRVAIEVAFAGGAPSSLRAALVMRSRPDIGRAGHCAGGLVTGTAGAFMISCGANEGDWRLTLEQSESVYAKQHSVPFLKGTLDVPRSLFGTSGSEPIEVNCLSRANGTAGEGDEHYLTELRHMFGRQEPE